MDFEKLKEQMGELEEFEVLSMLREVMEDGGTQVREAMDACQAGMDIVGQRFGTGEYFVSDLIFAGELMSEAMEILRPALLKTTSEHLGKLILCTVEGDLHDIGKNIVKSLLEVSGFEVVDLGIDVKPEAVVQVAKEQGIRIIALSGVLTLAIDSMKATVAAFEQAGLRQDVKLIIGGAPVTAEVCQVVGSDAWAVNPNDTINCCRAWVKDSSTSNKGL